MSLHSLEITTNLNDQPPPSYGLAISYVSEDTSSAQDLREMMLLWGIRMEHSPRQLLDHISLAGSSVLDPSMESLISPLARELWYHVRTESRAIQSKHFVFSSDKSLGRISAYWIPPPLTVASIKHHLCQEEGFGIQPRVNLFSNTSLPALQDDVLLPILDGYGAGTNSEQPLTLVVDFSGGAAHYPPASPRSPKRAPSIPQLPLFSIKKKSHRKLGHPLAAHVPLSPAYVPLDPDRFNIKLNPSRFDMNMSDPSWLSYKKGDVLFTDGVVKSAGPNFERVLTAQNSEGQIGYIYADDMSGTT